jgi:sterol desaturase/sphingolipid hydroxylase (fatty acid hydroxylase superfamily)
MIQTLIDAFVFVQGWLLDTLAQPLLLALGLGSYVEAAFDGVEFFLLGVIQLSLAFLLLRPLEALRPIEVWPDRKAVRVDVLYTLLDRVGVIPLGVFALLAPFFLALDSELRFNGIIPPQLEDVFPSLENQPLLSFFLYLLMLDFFQYWRHRLSHTLRWWWALHAIHHSQSQMTLWTDSRNHLLDDLVGGVWFALLALLIGVPPGHFVGLIVAVQMVENLSHVNARLSFGRLGEALLVSPRYHRWHHALDLPSGRQYRYGCNFAILFPLWDLLFGTQYFARAMPPTGIHASSDADSQIASAAHRGFWQQQRDGIVGLLAALRSPRHR